MLVQDCVEGPTNSSVKQGVRGQVPTPFSAFLIKELSVQAILISETENQDSGFPAKMAPRSQRGILKAELTGGINACTLAGDG